MAFKLTKVLISDSVDASCREILEGSSIPVDYKPGIAKDQLLSIIKVLKLIKSDQQMTIFTHRKPPSGSFIIVIELFLLC